jgi:hypothetical protein
MTCPPDPSIHGSDLLIVGSRDAPTVGWVRRRADLKGYAAWVCWDGVIYLACGRCLTRQSATVAINQWIETVTSPSLVDKLALVIRGPWTVRMSSLLGSRT